MSYPYEGMIAETISINGDKGESMSAESARELSAALIKAIVAADEVEGNRPRGT